MTMVIGMGSRGRSRGLRESGRVDEQLAIDDVETGGFVGAGKAEAVVEAVTGKS